MPAEARLRRGAGRHRQRLCRRL